ncbi:DUF6611 family protein [Nocardia sp. 348MFTsu5.1]|uniref:DUF6611 family protein n=1 Tax=Nocardia sp. 348MFTsu5.1 TaxID=1172185 RepID=UPI00036087EA|nr:DUF6611 family protein [Nocardia sp. 348MFTsu5.1]
MNINLAPPAATRRGPRWIRLLDGDQSWGSTDTWYSRHGTIRRRLVVFPPGFSATERRCLRLWRGWPLWGSGLWLTVEITLSNPIAPIAALIVSTTVVLLAGIAAFIRASGVRPGVRTQDVLVASDGLVDLDTMLENAEITRQTQTLIDADDQHAAGQINAIEHEAIWSTIYHQIPAAKPSIPGTQRVRSSAETAQRCPTPRTRNMLPH